MKYIPLILISILCLACNGTQKEEAKVISDSKSVEQEQTELKDLSTGNYSTLFINYNCDQNIEEIAELLNVPISDIEMPSNINNGENCVVRYSRNGTYESNLRWGSVPATKKGTEEAINRALKYKKDGVSILGSDILMAETKDCYLLRTPVNGRITIRSENNDGAFQLFYGPKGKRTKEQHEEMKVKMTYLANYMLKRHRK
jgi:hypothetical protein